MYIVGMDDKFPPNENSAKDDFVVPESGPGEEAASFNAKAQQEKFLGGGGSPETVQSNPLEASKQKESLDRKFVEVNGTRVSYIERGNPHGIPLMYIGGWASSASGDRWFLDALDGNTQNSKGFRTLSERKPASAERLQKNLDGLKQKYRILDLELPGFGKSSPLEGEVSLDRMADFTAEFQKEIRADKAIIFGSSMGGIVGVKLAGRHPEAVKALFLQGVMTERSDMAQKAYKGGQFLGSWPVREIVRIPGVFSKAVTAGSKTDADFKMSDKEAQTAMAEGFKLAHVKTSTTLVREIGKDIGEDIEKVKCPVVIIDGSAANTVTYDKQKMAAQKFPKQTLNYEKSQRTKTVNAIPLVVTEDFGEQGHTVVNTSPEILAVLVDKMSSKLLELTRTNENSDQGPEVDQ